MPTYKTKAIILKERDCLNADRLFSVYAENKGKLSLMVKAGKKIQSKLIPNFQSIAINSLLIAKGKSIDRLASSEIEQNYPEIKKDYKKIATVFGMLEFVDHLTHNSHPDNKIFDILVSYLQILDEKSFNINQLKNLLNFFNFKILDLSGYSPQLYNCLYCKEEVVPANNEFNPQRGGLVCKVCQEIENKIGIKITDNAIKVLRLAIKEPVDKLIRVDINKSLTNEFTKITEEFVKYHIEKPIKSNNYLNQILVP